MPRIFKEPWEFTRPWCPEAHYKPEVGVNHKNECWECARVQSMMRNRRYYNLKVKGKPPGYQDIPNLKAVREELGMNKMAFARALGVCVTSITHWEDQGVRIRRDTVAKIVPRLARLKREKNERIRRKHEALARRDAEARVKEPWKFGGNRSTLGDEDAA